MREIYLRYNDHELFDSMFTPDMFAFIMTHMDAFKVMWTEQGKTFWCRHLTMYRHHCYNFGTVHCLDINDMSPAFWSQECVYVLADQIFIILYDEFVNCRYGRAKELINGLLGLFGNSSLVMACRNTSIRNNPFYHPETRDVFEKLLGFSKIFPNGLKDVFLFHMAFPIYVIFGGSVYHVLKQWLSASDIKTSEEEYLEKCWESPFDLKEDFFPQPFHRHLLEKHGAYVDKLLCHGCFGLFSSKHFPSDSEKSTASTGRVFAKYLEYIQTRRWLPHEKNNSDDMKTDFLNYLRDSAVDIKNEEFRRSMILKMAEEKFQQELEEEEEEEEEINFNIKDIAFSKGSKTNLKGVNNHKSEKKCSCECSDFIMMVHKHDKSIHATCQTYFCNVESECLTGAGMIERSESRVSDLKSQVSSDDEIDNGVSADSVGDKQCHTVVPLETKTGGKKSRKKNKKKKGVQNSKPLVETRPKPKPEMNNEQVSSTSSSPSKRGIHKVSETSKLGTNDWNASKGSAAELAQIKKNIDTINQTVHEKNGLGLDGFRLMVETGKLLMSGNKKEDGSQPALHICAQCNKVEDKPKCFKKCGRCKQENVKWVRYYCSRECQAENWTSCHREEHENEMLAKQ